MAAPINPGPRDASVFPSGYCECPVNWTDQGLCCDGYGIWHHKSCGDISTKEMEYLERSSVVWHCCKCDSVDSFTFNSYELHTTNVFSPLSICQEQIYMYLLTHWTQPPRLAPYTRVVLILKRTDLQIQNRLQESVAVIAGVKIPWMIAVTFYQRKHIWDC